MKTKIVLWPEKWIKCGVTKSRCQINRRGMAVPEVPLIWVAQSLLSPGLGRAQLQLG